MRHGLRLMIALLAVSLLVTLPAFAQTTTEQTSVDPKAQAKADAEAKKQADKEAKEAEKKRKEEEKAAREAEKKSPTKRNSDIENIGNRDINKGPGLRVMAVKSSREVCRSGEAEI